ncbi:MG2 domain-containing protein [Flavobacterium flevense]|uniref:MG2 domain-containing protein n=1 Tax=Flavobacterium flevense TaxID=983 RepID=UPI000934C8BD|nr:MG2 domain-containing protein [Flavobacterium flevense]
MNRKTIQLVSNQLKEFLKQYMERPSHKTDLKIITILIWFLLLLPIPNWAQRNDLVVSTASFAEKIYLQLDRKIYTNGDTVWFKCIVSNASEHIPSHLSGVLYVELIGADEVIFEKKLIKIENGIGHGNFDLDKKIPKGNYLIRAYTQWNQNFEDDFFFEEYIQVFPTETENTEPIQNIKLIKEEAGSEHLEVIFNPKLIDSLQKNKLNVYISVDDKKDSLQIKKGKNDQYILDYPIDKESQFATLKIETENQKTAAKTFVLNKEYMDLQFFPESGELVHGLSSKVGFKAIDAIGKGKIIEGAIVDEKENSITTFKSNSLGMGSFILINADSSKKYYARLKSPSLNNKSLYPLPDVAAAGNTLSVYRQRDKVVLKVVSNYMKNDSIFVRISFRGVDLYEKKVSLNQGFYQSLISTAEIPEGIISFTILDHSKKTIAERLYFNEKPESRIKINLATDKPNYNKRELTNLNIQTTNFNGEAVKANTSVLVINKKELGTMQNLRQNILSYFLIDSELKGNIENPGYYFKNDSSMHDDLDVLMLTQGWSKYNYSKPNKSSLNINPEKTLTLSGRVNNLFSEKKGKKDVEVTLMTSGTFKSFYKQKTDSLGKFKFDLNDEYGKEIEILIQTANKSDKKINNSVVLDQKKSPHVSFESTQAIEQIDSIVNKFIEKSRKQKEIDEKFDVQFGGILLDQVKVNAKMGPNKEKVTEKYGKPETIISGKEILSKEKKWSYGLYSVLLFNYPDKVRIERMPDQNLYATVNNMPTLVIIDGIPVQFRDYGLIPNISPSEVSSFEIIEYANGFGELYCEVHSELQPCIPPLPSWGHVIAIYTHAGIGLFGAQKPKGLTKTTVPVFATAKEFYAPKYDNIQADDWQHSDIRTLIHWQPILQTDDSGKAFTSFYNTDNKEQMMIIVEAISDEGEIGYQELNYEIIDTINK